MKRQVCRNTSMAVESFPELLQKLRGVHEHELEGKTRHLFSFFFEISPIGNFTNQWLWTVKHLYITKKKLLVTFTVGQQNFSDEIQSFQLGICMISSFVWGQKNSPCRFFSWLSRSHEFAALTNRKLLGLKVTSVWVLLHKSLHCWLWTLDLFCLRNLANVNECTLTTTTA